MAWLSFTELDKAVVAAARVHKHGREEQPHVQGVAAAWAQESQEELLHVQGQEGRWKYPSSKVRSSSCALLEQL